MSSGGSRVDTSVGTLPVTGANPAKAKFFREVASAFEFLALYHSLAADDQRALMEVVQSFQSQKGITS